MTEAVRCLSARSPESVRDAWHSAPLGSESAMNLVASVALALFAMCSTATIASDSSGKGAREFRPSARVVIVELMDEGWPIPRSMIAGMVALALENGAIAVGIDIDMSTPLAASEDAELATLLDKDRRVVPLSFGGKGNRVGPEGFAMAADGKVRGLRCDSKDSIESQAFAIRLAIAAGQSRDDIYRYCRNAVLQPRSWRSRLHFTTIPARELKSHASRGLMKGAVAVLGTTNPMLGTRTPVGEFSTSVVNAFFVESALRRRWK